MGKDKNCNIKKNSFALIALGYSDVKTSTGQQVMDDAESALSGHQHNNISTQNFLCFFCGDGLMTEMNNAACCIVCDLCIEGTNSYSDLYNKVICIIDQHCKSNCNKDLVGKINDKHFAVLSCTCGFEKIIGVNSQ